MRRICQTLLCLSLCAGCASVRNSLHSAVSGDSSKSPAASVAMNESASEQDPRSSSEHPSDQSDDEFEQVDDGSNVSDEPGKLASASLTQTGYESSVLISSENDDSGIASSAADQKLFLTTVSLQADDMETAAPPDAANANSDAVQFDEVIGSVYQSYPLLQSALFNRNIALGRQIGAMGAFDTKLKGASENMPQGFYENYRHNIGVVQPTEWGGEVFAGYRIGRGDVQPWYQERVTNEGGEFKAGVLVPLARNRDIDARRAELWKAGIERTLAEPDIQAQLIDFVQEASYGYWDWVAAGESHRIAKRILALAEDRTNRIESQVEAGLIDPPELTDNLRLVAIRQAKTSDTRRKLEQTASKLSVYYRDAVGNPLVPSEEQLPGFPEPEPIDDDALSSDIQTAISQRPELRILDLLRRQTQVDYAEARNQLQPELNAVLTGAQDVGEPSSSKRDKSPYEGEASVYLDVPLQRRKARGKMTELQGKLAQLSAKRRITTDKISIDVQMAHAAVKSAWEQVEQTREALKYAEDLATRERTNQEAGLSDLLKVTLREQYAVESAEKNIEALQLYFQSRADYRAAMALDQIDR